MGKMRQPCDENGALYQLFGILILKTNKKHLNDRKHICHVDLLSTACTLDALLQ